MTHLESNQNSIQRGPKNYVEVKKSHNDTPQRKKKLRIKMESEMGAQEDEEKWKLTEEVS